MEVYKMHVTIYFIASGKDLDDAVNRINSYLETENFYDGYNVLEDEGGTLEEKREKVAEWAAAYDWKKEADGFYSNAEAQKAQGNISMAGYYYRKAGSLYEQLLTDDATIYNIDSYDYSIPNDDKELINGEKWFCVPVDFHV
jgi:hypothetical protein